MNHARVGGLVVAAIVVLLLGVLIGTHLAASGGTAAPAIPTSVPTGMAVPTATAIPVPAGLGTRYYESDNADSGQVELGYVGRLVVAHVTYNLGLGANPVYTGTVTGTTLRAKAPSLPALHNPGADDMLMVRVMSAGQEEVTLGYAKNDVGVATASVHFPAICGLKTDAYRYQSCHALTKP